MPNTVAIRQCACGDRLKYFEFVVWPINFRQVNVDTQPDERAMCCCRAKDISWFMGATEPLTVDSNMKAKNQSRIFHAINSDDAEKLIKSLIYAYLWWTECEVALISFSMYCAIYNYLWTAQLSRECCLDFVFFWFGKTPKIVRARVHTPAVDKHGKC